jgi:dephospho-CoA kinase
MERVMTSHDPDSHNRGSRIPVIGIPVIGIVGGIGSGKSTVARVFASLGCVVSDSDTDAKGLLETPNVRGLLVERWGEGVLGGEGTIDRASVGRVVFGDPAERKWLESVIHPRLHAMRADRLAEAVRAGAAGFVIDAPLLFEAGLEGECDAVVFVECPREERLRRVMESRGWDADELERREKAQWPLDEKRRRSDYSVINAGDRASMEAGVREVFDQIRRETRSRMSK